MYIAIEGIDTAGKSTQIALLQEAFSEAVVTKEPGATTIGHEIRDIVLNGDIKSSKAEFLLFLADRAEHLEHVVKPNLDKLIISDRSVVSGIAYAMVKQDISLDDIIKLNHFATDGIYPEKVFLLELSPKELEFRLSQKELDGIESRGTEYLLKIQEALKVATQALAIQLVSIDAKKSIESISQEIIKNI